MLQAGVVPRNTKKDTILLVKVYADWVFARNEESRKFDFLYKWDTVPPLSQDMSLNDLNNWLQRFVIAAQRKNGSNYPTVSLKHLCVGIWHHMRKMFNRPRSVYLRDQISRILI